MYDIITFGSATIDIFLKPRGFKILKGKDFITLKGICFPMGSKIEIDDFHTFIGGGGTNTAATFAKQGFNVAYCGSIGDDLAGQEIINELKRTGIDSQLVFKTKEKKTNHSVVITALKAREDRTILVYRGASEVLGKEHIPWDKLEAKWFYLAPLSGKLCELFGEIVDFAKNKGAKVAANPGLSQLSLPSKKLGPILKKIDILILNQEEASFLTKIPFQKEKEIFKKIDILCPGIVIMTKGEKGAVVADGKNMYSAKSPKIKVADRTGAGDSFASGFISEFILSDGNIEKAVQLAIANSSSCLKGLGAKNGLLKRGESFERVRVEKNNCCTNNICACQLK